MVWHQKTLFRVHLECDISKTIQNRHGKVYIKTFRNFCSLEMCECHYSTLDIGGVVAWNQQCSMTSQKGFIFSEPAQYNYFPSSTNAMHCCIHGLCMFINCMIIIIMSITAIIIWIWPSMVESSHVVPFKVQMPLLHWGAMAPPWQQGRLTWDTCSYST